MSVHVAQDISKVRIPLLLLEDSEWKPTFVTVQDTSLLVFATDNAVDEERKVELKGCDIGALRQQAAYYAFAITSGTATSTDVSLVLGATEIKSLMTFRRSLVLALTPVDDQIPSFHRRKTSTQPSHMSNEEYEMVQRKSFARWLNSVLSRRSDLRVDEEKLFADLSTGVILINTVEILSEESLGKYSKKPKTPFQRIENLSKLVTFLRKRGHNLVNIGPEDIEKGNPKPVLGLLWRLILRYQINQGGKSESKSDKSADSSASAELLQWIAARCAPHNVPVTNFTSSFQDGRVVSVLCNEMGEHIDIASLMVPLEDTALALTIAELKYGVPRIIDAEDMVERPDKHSIMTYASLLRSKILQLQAKQKHIHGAIREYTTLDGAGATTAYAGIPTSFRIIAATGPAATDRMVTGGVRFKVNLTSADNKPVDSEVRDLGNGVYEVTYTATQTGTHQLNVFADDDTEPIQGCPQQLSVVDKPCLCAEHSHVELVSLASLPLQHTKLYVWCKDEHKARLPALDRDDINVEATMVAKDSSASSSSCHVEVTYNDADSRCEVAAWSEHKGEFTLDVKVNGQRLPGFKPIVLQLGPSVVETADAATQTELTGGDIERLQEDNKRLTAQLLAAEEQNKKLQNTVDGLQATVDELQGNTDEKDVALAELKGNYKTLLEDLAKAQPKLTEWADKLAEADRERDDLKAHLAKEQAARAKLKEKCAKQTEALATVTALRKENASQAETIEEMKSRIQELEDDLKGDAVHAKLALLTSQYELEKQENAGWKRKYDELRRSNMMAAPATGGGDRTRGNSVELRMAGTKTQLLEQQVQHLTEQEKSLTNELGLMHKRLEASQQEYRVRTKEYKRKIVDLTHELAAAQKDLARTQGGQSDRAKLIDSAGAILGKLVPYMGLEICSAVSVANTPRGSLIDTAPAGSSPSGIPRAAWNGTSREEKLTLAEKVLRERLEKDQPKIRSVLVNAVKSGCPAERAGFKAGDYIEQVEGTPVETSKALKKRLHAAEAGDTLAFSVRRGGDILVLTVEVTSTVLLFEHVLALRRIRDGIVRPADTQLLRNLRLILARKAKTRASGNTLVVSQSAPNKLGRRQFMSLRPDSKRKKKPDMSKWLRKGRRAQAKRKGSTGSVGSDKGLDRGKSSTNSKSISASASEPQFSSHS